VDYANFSIKKCDIRADDLIADSLQFKEAMDAMRQESIDRLAREVAKWVDQRLGVEELPITMIEFPEPEQIRFKVRAYCGPFI
jgi:hypothetical protein